MHGEEDEVDPNWFGAPEDQPFKKNTVAKDTTCPTPVVESSTAKTPAASSPAAPIPQPEPAAPVSDQMLAWRLENGAAASYVKSAVNAGVGEVGDINVVHHYVTGIAKKCAVDDPLEQMLLDQILICYHRVAALHVSSSQGRTPEATTAYNSAAVKLQAELRRSVLALRELQRMPLEAGVFIQQMVRVQRGATEPDSKKN